MKKLSTGFDVGKKTYLYHILYELGSFSKELGRGKHACLGEWLGQVRLGWVSNKG